MFFVGLSGRLSRRRRRPQALRAVGGSYHRLGGPEGIFDSQPKILELRRRARELLFWQLLACSGVHQPELYQIDRRTGLTAVL